MSHKFDTWHLFKRELMALLRNPVFLAMGISTPILYLALFAPLLENFAGMKGFEGMSVLNTFIPGMLTLIAFTGGTFAGFGIIDELRSGVLERFRVTPCSRFALMAGPVFCDTVGTMSQVLVFILIGLPFGFRMSLMGAPLIFLLLGMLVVTTSAFGNAIGLVCKSEDKYAPIVHGLTYPVILLSGMLLPMAMAPKWLQILAHFNPLYYVVEACRLLAVGSIGNVQVALAFGVVTVIMTLSLLFAKRTFSRAVY